MFYINDQQVGSSTNGDIGGAATDLSNSTEVAYTHTLLLTMTRFNAVQWKSQLHALAGVAKIEAPFKAMC